MRIKSKVNVDGVWVDFEVEGTLGELAKTDYIVDILRQSLPKLAKN